MYLVVLLIKRENLAARKTSTIWMTIEPLIELLQIFNQKIVLNLKQVADLNLITYCYQLVQIRKGLISSKGLLNHKLKNQK